MQTIFLCDSTYFLPLISLSTPEHWDFWTDNFSFNCFFFNASYSFCCFFVAFWNPLSFLIRSIVIGSNTRGSKTKEQSTYHTTFEVTPYLLSSLPSWCPVSYHLYYPWPTIKFREKNFCMVQQTNLNSHRGHLLVLFLLGPHESSGVAKCSHEVFEAVRNVNLQLDVAKEHGKRHRKVGFCSQWDVAVSGLQTIQRKDALPQQFTIIVIDSKS